jgi:Lrp/AsnC family transcriptional regulator, regulator of ectoine-degradation genes
MIRLDERDIQILSILQRNGRITKTELARRVNLSPTPCWERLQRLEKVGLIEGYCANLASDLVKDITFIIMEVELESHKQQDFDRFEQAVQARTEVLDCWAVGGGIDYFLKIATASVNDYQRFVDDLLNAQLGLKRYYTYIVTKQVKQSSAISDKLLRNLFNKS